jgi:hypothetical protein
MAMNAALEGVKRVLKEEKKEGNSAAAIRNCQALHVGVLELLQAVERHRAGDSCNGGAGETTRELSRLLCHCFSVSAQILTLCKEVESGPSWLFEDLSTHLSVIFKSTYALIKVCRTQSFLQSCLMLCLCLGVDRVARQVESQSGDI